MRTCREMEHSRAFRTDSESQFPEYVETLFVIEKKKLNRKLCARDYLLNILFDCKITRNSNKKVTFLTLSSGRKFLYY